MIEREVPNLFDILVVGSGAAGLYASLCLPSHLRVGLVTKDSLKSGSSPWAQGGIAAAIYPPDTPNQHLKDTLKAGAGLCDQEAVQFLVDHATEAIAFLVKLGVDFDRQGEVLATTLEAAHSYPRVLHSRDTTGRAIVDVLIAKVLERPNIQVLSQAVSLSLWLNPQTRHCQGINILYQNQILGIRAKAVVLATGGGGQVFAKTTNPAVSTGDGIAIAWRAGAMVRDLEFFQFHPTALMKPGNKIRYRFPNIIQVCQQWGIDVFNDLIPIAPAAHYWMGGIACDVMNRTSISGLYAIGETASTGVHGANRLASNSLLECLVFASQLARIESDLDGEIKGNFYSSLEPLSLERIKINDSVAPSADRIATCRQDLAALMWHSAGICRTQTVMESAIATIKTWQNEFKNWEISQYLLNLKSQHTVQFLSPENAEYLKSLAEILNLLDIAHLIIKSAVFRTESRGGHYRLDYPKTHSEWQIHTVIKGDCCTSIPTRRD